LSQIIGNPEEAVAYYVAALAIRLKIGARVGANVQALAVLHHSLGSERFRAALPSGMDEESIGNLMEMLDDYKENSAQES
jgi:hypothetical protein